MFGPGVVRDLQIDRHPGQTETRVQAQLVHASTSLWIDAEVSGDVADHNRFEVMGSLGSAALTGWSRLEHLGQTSEATNATPATLDGLVALLEGRSDHRLAGVDEALAVVQSVEAMLQQ